MSNNLNTSCNNDGHSALSVPGCDIWLNSNMPPIINEENTHEDCTNVADNLEEERASAATICVFIGVSLVFDVLKWYAPAILAEISQAEYSTYNLKVIKRGLDFGSGMSLFIGVVMLLHLMRRAWWTVQPAARLRRDLRIPKPDWAVRLLFIPLFNFYWVFVAFKNLMDAANFLRAKRRLSCRPFCSETAGLFAVTFVAATLFYSITWLWIMPLPHPTVSFTLLHQFAQFADWYLDLMPLHRIAAAMAWYIGRVLLLPIACDVARIINTLR